MSKKTTDKIQKCINEQSRIAQYLKDHPDGDEVRGAQLGVSDWMAEEAIERTSYESFLESRRQFADGDGFAAGVLPSFLFPFQESLVRWALRKGRAAIFADCGLGKTPMFLVWADQVVRRVPRGVPRVTEAIGDEGAAVGDLMFYGRGAGGDPTGSAVLGDLIDAHAGAFKRLLTREQGKAQAGAEWEVGGSAVWCREIAKQKMPDMNAHDVDAATRMIIGSTKSMGLQVVE